MPDFNQNDIDRCFNEYKKAQLLNYLVAAKEPYLVLNGGQPGSGKSALNFSELKEFKHDAVIIDDDFFRTHHPMYNEWNRKGIKDYKELTQPFCSAVVEKLKDFCVSRRFNIILETTLQDKNKVFNNIRGFSAAGYKTRINVLAVPALISTIGINIRYEKAIANGLTARPVSQERHDFRYNQLPATIAHLQRDKAPVEEFKIYKRNYIVNGTGYDRELVLKAKNPTNWRQTYLQLRDEKLSTLDMKYMNNKISEIISCMKKRGVPEKDRADFINSCKTFQQPKSTGTGKEQTGTREL